MTHPLSVQYIFQRFKYVTYVTNMAHTIFCLKYAPDARVRIIWMPLIYQFQGFKNTNIVAVGAIAEIKQL